jgi:hypothetical protein
MCGKGITLKKHVLHYYHIMQQYFWIRSKGSDPCGPESRTLLKITLRARVS